MKEFAVIVLLAIAGVCVEAKIECTDTPADVPQEWLDMTKQCTQEMRKQIQEEMSAAVQYMAMAAYFSRDTVNRPGFAEMFFKSASEEREHAMKLMSYLMMRGELTENLQNLIKFPHVTQTTWPDAVSALKDALRLEAHVTKKIKGVIVACENDQGANDYHLVDYLTSDFLEEQYAGQRELAGRISTLGKMLQSHGALGEFLYDKKLMA